MEAVFIDADETQVKITRDDGREVFCPANESNRDYRQLVKEGVTIAAYSAPAKTWVDVKTVQKEMIENVRWQVERHVTQRELGMAEVDRDISVAVYDDLLQYLQDIRDQDEANHASPDDAIAALALLVSPV